ncbi:MAG TPA: NAD(P)-binding domain-containing protein [Amycolatopsis sp.]|nr:NAD(P)-binding domain-containing protein [Amycolatopsis sp.]
MTATGLSFGWIGTGRMGYLLASRLLRGGHEVAVYNRSWVHVESLLELGARIADRASQLVDQDIVFTTMPTSEDFRYAMLGPHGLFSVPGHCPLAVVDCSAVSDEVAAEVRAVAQRSGTRLIVAGRPAEVKEFPWLLQV